MTEAKEQIESFLNDAKVWSFNVKFNNNPENWSIMDEFKTFCKKESSNNYLLGIKKLIDYYTMDFKYASLFDLIEHLRSDLIDVSTQLESMNRVEESEPVSDKGFKTFGE